MNKELLNLYKNLVEKFYDDKGECLIRQNTDWSKECYTCVPAFAGSKVGTGKVNLMLVGRAVNGWNAEWNGSAEDVAKQVLSINFDIDKLNETSKTGEGTADEYNFNKCKFIKLGKSVTKELGCDEENPFSHIIWTNMYKVAPADVNSEDSDKKVNGNPSGEIQHTQREIAIEILKKEIEIYKPSHILFVVDDWLSWRWHNKKENCAFIDTFAYNKTEFCDEYINGVGKYNDIPFVVCYRPETRKEDKMVEQVIKAFNGIKE